MVREVATKTLMALGAFPAYGCVFAQPGLVWQGRGAGRMCLRWLRRIDLGPAQRTSEPWGRAGAELLAAWTGTTRNGPRRAYRGASQLPAGTPRIPRRAYT